MAAAASSFGTTCRLRRAAQAFAISHSHILRSNANLSLQRNFCSHLTVSTSSASGVSQTVQALKGEVDLLLKGVGERSVMKEVKHILEMARRASLKREILHTYFLTPPVLKEYMQVLEKLADVKAIAQGGYPQAECCRISVGHPEELASDPDIISALSITRNFLFEPCSHGDFLGSILGTGIVREKLGDIILQASFYLNLLHENLNKFQPIVECVASSPPAEHIHILYLIEEQLQRSAKAVGEQGAQIIVVPELVEFLMSTLVKVRNVPASCTKIPLISLDYEPPSNGDVRINWIHVTTKGTTLKSGDIVSVSGKGRLKIGEINSTKKGKFAVELIQYL
ncbi:putative RNA-binding protein YlmH [Glycine soja]